MNITNEKVQFARDILESGTTEIILRDFDSELFLTQMLTRGRDYRARQGRDVIILMTAMMYLDNVKLDGLPAEDKVLGRKQIDVKATRFYDYLDRGDYSVFFHVFITKQLLSYLKLQINFEASSTMVSEIKRIKHMAVNGRKNSPDRM